LGTNDGSHSFKASLQVAGSYAFTIRVVR